MLYDLSPLSIEGIYNNPKTESDKVVAMVMIAAKEFQPAIIYIDECEKVFPKSKKKKGKKKAETVAPSRIKKALQKNRIKEITDETRITIIGCTSEPHEGSKKDFQKFFDKSIYFPFPDYTTRRLMWKSFMQNTGIKLPQEFPLSTLAHISDGYSSGSIKRTCENVLTAYRRSVLKDRPLLLSEFIGPLSLCSVTMIDQWEEYKNFTDFITGDEDRRAKIEAELKGDEDGKDDPKKGKTKKKGKKKK